MDNKQLKRGPGRPKKTPEELKEARKIYMREYQRKRYKEDFDYKESKKKAALRVYHEKNA